MASLEPKSDHDEGDRKNLLLFLSSPLAERYCDRIPKYYQRHAGYVFYASDISSFVEITKNSGKTWHVLIVGRELFETYQSNVQAIIDENPGMRTAVLSTAEESGAPHYRSGGLGFIEIVDKYEIDDWLEQMSRIL